MRPEQGQYTRGLTQVQLGASEMRSVCTIPYLPPPRRILEINYFIS